MRLAASLPEESAFVAAKTSRLQRDTHSTVEYHLGVLLTLFLCVLAGRVFHFESETFLMTHALSNFAVNFNLMLPFFCKMFNFSSNLVSILAWQTVRASMFGLQGSARKMVAAGAAPSAGHARDGDVVVGAMGADRPTLELPAASSISRLCKFLV